MSLPDLPVDLSNGQVVLTANTASDYWSLRFRGFSEENVEDALSPAEKAARTRAANKAKSEHPDENPSAQAGDANE